MTPRRRQRSLLPVRNVAHDAEADLGGGDDVSAAAEGGPGDEWAEAEPAAADDAG